MAMTFTDTSIVLLVAFNSVLCAPFDISYGPSVPLKAEIFFLRWATSGTRPQDFIKFELTVATRGWVAVGISRNGGMAGADMAIYQPDTNTLQDFYSTANSLPIVDQHQDYQLISVNRNDSHTILVIRRKLITCDPDDVDIRNGTTKVIWAYGDQPKLQYHRGGNIGVINLLLLSPHSDRVLAEADPTDILMANMSNGRRIEEVAKPTKFPSVEPRDDPICDTQAISQANSAMRTIYLIFLIFLFLCLVYTLCCYCCFC